MAETMSSDNRSLIELARKANKLLSLYVLALQEEMALTTNDHVQLARTLHGIADTIEQDADGTLTGSAPAAPSGECRTK